MNRTRKVGLVLVALLVSSCAEKTDEAAEQPADTAAAMPAAQVADANGTWDMRSVPISGDTTPTIFQVKVENGTWTLLLPNRDPITATVMTDGDSIMVDAGPYESVRRKGVMVTTHTVYRISGDQMSGMTVARYQNAGADSVLQLTSTGTRVR